MLTIRNLAAAHGQTPILCGIDLQVGNSEIVVVLGASGSGKTTLLRVVAGLHPPQSGRLLWNDADISSHPPEKRDFGLVFQDYALFPHLDVSGNVGFGLKMQGVTGDAATSRIARALEAVGLRGMGSRRVTRLSGGQEQRVALARALAPQPRLLLLDEPLGSLDRALRESLAGELRHSISQSGVPALYVTHDQEEAFAVADRIAVLDGGRFVQVGTPGELWRNPVTRLVASLLGIRTIVAATVVGGVATTPFGPVPTPGVPDGAYQMAIKPEAYVESNGGFAASVLANRFRGHDHIVTCRAGATSFEASMPNERTIGSTLRLMIDPSGVSVLDD